MSVSKKADVDEKSPILLPPEIWSQILNKWDCNSELLEFGKEMINKIYMEIFVDYKETIRIHKILPFLRVKMHYYDLYKDEGGQHTWSCINMLFEIACLNLDLNIMFSVNICIHVICIRIYNLWSYSNEYHTNLQNFFDTRLNLGSKFNNFEIKDKHKLGILHILMGIGEKIRLLKNVLTMCPDLYNISKINFKKEDGGIFYIRLYSKDKINLHTLYHKYESNILYSVK